MPPMALLPESGIMSDSSGGRSVVVNVPITYPVTDISGSIVSGIPPWYIDERSVSPASLLKTLKDQGYEIDTPMSRALEKQPELLVNRLIETEERRVNTFLQLASGRGRKMVLWNDRIYRSGSFAAQAGWKGPT